MRASLSYEKLFFKKRERKTIPDLGRCARVHYLFSEVTDIRLYHEKSCSGPVRVDA